VLTINELEGLTSRLNIFITPDQISALFQRIDTNGNGVIEFDEFYKLILEDPYK
jgi:Ca2+-binding EF-hand superfamily protein